MCKVIPFMELVNGEYFIFDVNLPKPKVFCKVFGDNQIFISVSESSRLSPIEKHIAIKYHHLQSLVQKKIIPICYIDTQEKTAEIITKPLDQSLFIYLRRKISGW